MAEQDPLFTLDQLLIVRAIAQHGSFRRAADSLYLSQPAVSLQVQNLERQLGVVLFNRGGRQVYITEAGQTLVEYGDRILKLCQEARRALSDLDEMKRGILLLGASQTVGTYVMPQLIGQFWHRYPQISVQLLVQSTRRVTHKLVSGELDLAIVGGEIPTELRPRLTVTPFAQDQFVLVTAREHPHGIDLLTQRDPELDPIPLVVADLSQLRYISLDAQSSTRQTLDRALHKAGVDPATLRSSVELSSIEAIKRAVQAGLGVAFLSRSAVKPELDRGDLIQLPVAGLEVKRILWLAYNPDRYQSRAAHLFRDGLLTGSDWVKTPLPLIEPFLESEI